MPRPSLKRQQAVRAAPPSSAITNFARVAKSHAYADTSVKTSIVVQLPAAGASRKRKAGSLEQDASVQLSRRAVSFPPISDDEASRQQLQQPQRTTWKRARRAEPSEWSSAEAAPAAGAASPSVQVAASTKGRRLAEATPSRTKISRKPGQAATVARSAQDQKTTQITTDAAAGGSSPQAAPGRAPGGAFIHKKKKTEEEGAAAPMTEERALLPGDLAQLVALNRAFLSTVLLYIAHNGCTSPIDIRLLAPDVSRTWGKRQVTVEDVRRCIAIQFHRQPSCVPRFLVSDYGRARVCVEVVVGPDGPGGLVAERLCRQFEDNLRALCAEKALDQMADVDVPLARMSLSDLPQAAVRDMDDGRKADALFAQGQRVLDDLKSGIAAKKQERQRAADKRVLLHPDGTGMGLLDRIRHKQLARANEPLPPSGPQLQRRAALNRVADVAATLSMLSLSNPMALPRQAFTMMAITDKLKDSLRVPLSKEEAVACVRLIATEIAPEWLRIVPIGGRENVVIHRHGQPVDRIIHERVRKLLAA